MKSSRDTLRYGPALLFVFCATAFFSAGCSSESPDAGGSPSSTTTDADTPAPGPADPDPNAAPEGNNLGLYRYLPADTSSVVTLESDLLRESELLAPLLSRQFWFDAREWAGFDVRTVERVVAAFPSGSGPADPPLVALQFSEPFRQATLLQALVGEAEQKTVPGGDLFVDASGTAVSFATFDTVLFGPERLVTEGLAAQTPDASLLKLLERDAPSAGVRVAAVDPTPAPLQWLGSSTAVSVPEGVGSAEFAALLSRLASLRVDFDANRVQLVDAAFIVRNAPDVDDVMTSLSEYVASLSDADDSISAGIARAASGGLFRRDGTRITFACPLPTTLASDIALALGRENESGTGTQVATGGGTTPNDPGTTNPPNTPPKPQETPTLQPLAFQLGGQPAHVLFPTKRSVRPVKYELKSGAVAGQEWTGRIGELEYTFAVLSHIDDTQAASKRTAEELRDLVAGVPQGTIKQQALGSDRVLGTRLRFEFTSLAIGLRATGFGIVGWDRKDDESYVLATLIGIGADQVNVDQFRSSITLDGEPEPAEVTVADANGGRKTATVSTPLPESIDDLVGVNTPVTNTPTGTIDLSVSNDVVFEPLQTEKKACSFTLSEDRSRVIVAYPQDDEVRVFDSRTGNLERTLRIDSPRSILNRNGEVHVVSEDTSEIVTFDASDWSKVKSTPIGMKESFLISAPQGDAFTGVVLVSAHPKGGGWQTRKVDLNTGESTEVLRADFFGSAVFSADGKWVFVHSATYLRPVKCYRVEAEKFLEPGNKSLSGVPKLFDLRSGLHQAAPGAPLLTDSNIYDVEPWKRVTDYGGDVGLAYDLTSRTILKFDVAAQTVTALVAEAPYTPAATRTLSSDISFDVKEYSNGAGLGRAVWHPTAFTENGRTYIFVYDTKQHQVLRAVTRAFTDVESGFASSDSISSDVVFKPMQDELDASSFELSEDLTKLFVTHPLHNVVHVYDTETGERIRSITSRWPRSVVCRGGHAHILSHKDWVIQVYRIADWELVNKVATKLPSGHYISAPRGDAFKNVVLVSGHSGDGWRTRKINLETKETTEVLFDSWTGSAEFSADGTQVLAQMAPFLRPVKVFPFEGEDFLRAGNKDLRKYSVIRNLRSGLHQPTADAPFMTDVNIWDIRNRKPLTSNGDKILLVYDRTAKNLLRFDHGVDTVTATGSESPYATIETREYTPKDITTDVKFYQHGRMGRAIWHPAAFTKNGRTYIFVYDTKKNRVLRAVTRAFTGAQPVVASTGTPASTPQTESDRVVFKALHGSSDARTFAITEDRKECIVAHTEGDVVSVYDVATGQLKRTIRVDKPRYVFTRGDQLVVASLRSGTFSLYNRAEDYAFDRTFPAGLNNVIAMSAPIGKAYKDQVVVTVQEGWNFRANVVDLKRGTSQQVLDHRDRGVLTVDPLGKFVFAHDDTRRVPFKVIVAPAAAVLRPGATNWGSFPQAKTTGPLYQVAPKAPLLSDSQVHSAKDIQAITNFPRGFLTYDETAGRLYTFDAASSKVQAREVDSRLSVLAERQFTPNISANSDQGFPDTKWNHTWSRPHAFTLGDTLYVFVLDRARGRVMRAETSAFGGEAESDTPAVAGSAELTPEQAEEAAAAKLKLAKSFLNRGRASTAKRWLREITRDYPDTKAAEEAQKLLAE